MSSIAVRGTTQYHGAVSDPKNYELIHELSPYAFYKAQYINDRVYIYTEAFAQALSASAEALSNFDLISEDHVHFEDLDAFRLTFDQWFTSDKKLPLKRTYRVVLPSQQHPVWIEEVVAYKHDDAYPIRGLLRLLDDSAHALSKLYALSQKVPVMLFEFELGSGGQMRMPFTNAYVEKLFGVSQNEVLNDINGIIDAVSIDDIDELKASITESAIELKPWEAEFRTEVNGKFKWLRGFSVPEKASSKLIRWHGVITDITEQREREKKYRQRSEIDDMTGLVNRAHFIERFQQTQKTQRAAEKNCALLIADIDKFKRINDTHGHPFGDVVIKGVALSLLSSFRSTDVVGRIGGEEYAVLLTDTNEENLLRVAERARTDIANLEHCEDDIKERVTITIGATRFDQLETWEDVFSRADEALYAGKNSGRNKVVIR